MIMTLTTIGGGPGTRIQEFQALTEKADDDQVIHQSINQSILRLHLHCFAILHLILIIY
jgi:hypothetical protein